ncbi:MAG: nucleotidyltransferase domain-containing protein [bacterium]|nr:nucleotidyltransferase domain-containing protein [bacterium]
MTTGASVVARPQRPALAGGLDEFHGLIKRTVRVIEPDAEVILYGSRARGDAEADSDWDLLILVDGPVDAARETAIRHRLYELEWDSDEVLCSVICNREDWSSPLYRAMPFHQNVDRDGIVL